MYSDPEFAQNGRQDREDLSSKASGVSTNGRQDRQDVRTGTDVRTDRNDRQRPLFERTSGPGGRLAIRWKGGENES